MKKLLLILLCFPMIFLGQNVNIPDANFKAYLLGNTVINTNGDTEIQVSEAIVFNGTIDCANLNISDLTGIEDFTDLTELFCTNNNLTSLDVSANIALIQLHCANNQLTSLDISAATALYIVQCQNNDLTSLDVSNNTSLTFLYCSGNPLTNLDVTNNIALILLQCNGNDLTSLDVSTNTALTTLYCQDNQLTSLDVINNTAVINLYCSWNLLTSLDVSNNTALTTLHCNDNQLTSLDVSTNTALTTLHCYLNQLTSLDVSGATALTTSDCNFNQLSSLDVSNNTSLTFLYCSGNQITNLYVSANTALTTLHCYLNQLTSLDLSGATALTTLSCNHNQLTSLDLSLQTSLIDLLCYNNQLTFLDVRNGNNTNITQFKAFNNPNLLCIDVDNVAWSTANWTNIDASTSFGANCVTAYCDSIQINLISIDTLSNPKTIDFEVNPNYTTNYNFPYCGLFLLDNNGDTLAYQPLLSGNVYGITQGLTETRTLEATSNFSYFFSGVLQIVNDWHSGGPTYLACSFPINFLPTGVHNIFQKDKKICKILDILGKETKGTKNEILFCIYDDGTVEKRIIIE